MDTRLLLAHVTGMSREDLIREPGRAIDPAAFQTLLDRRATREPMALILGSQEFWSLNFQVSPATLIPRPETETLIEAALAARPGGVGSILDLGTGTGCLLLAALTEFPSAWGVGIDRNPAAAALAAANAAELGLQDRATIVCADWAAPLAARFDLILSNPPYIPSDDIPCLMPEVSRFEPTTALNGGADGLDAYRALLAALPGLLNPGGLAVLELGTGQGPGFDSLARKAGFPHVAFRADLAGIDRAVIIEAG